MDFFYVRRTCLLKQTASGAQSVTSPSKIEGFMEVEADLSALFYGRGRGLDDRGKSKLSESPQNM